MRSNGLDIQGGWDYRPNARTVVGATFGYDRERFAVAGVDTSGKAQVYTGGAYAGFNPGAWTLSANLRSEEHTSELQSLMRISYAVFCLKKKNTHRKKTHK